MRLRFSSSLYPLLILALLAACQATATQPTAPTATAVPTEPPATSIPPAATVNDEPISMADYLEELARLQDTRGTDLATEEAQELVLNALIERRLLAQGAIARRISIDDQTIDQKILDLEAQLGGQEFLQTWLRENHYSVSSFRNALLEESFAAKMINEIVNLVSPTEFHAHARHILLRTREEAQLILDQIEAGADFGELASLHSLDLSTRPGGGDLGWFPTGTLTDANVEQAIFNLQPNELGEIIESELGHHIIQLLALEVRDLSTSAMAARNEAAVVAWLEGERASAGVEIFVTP